MEIFFLNLDEISVKGNLIVSQRDTLPIKLHIEFKFNNGKSFQMFKTYSQSDEKSNGMDCFCLHLI